VTWDVGGLYPLLLDVHVWGVGKVEVTFVSLPSPLRRVKCREWAVSSLRSVAGELRGLSELERLEVVGECSDEEKSMICRSCGVDVEVLFKS